MKLPVRNARIGMASKVNGMLYIAFIDTAIYNIPLEFGAKYFILKEKARLVSRDFLH